MKRRVRTIILISTMSACVCVASSISTKNDSFSDSIVFEKKSFCTAKRYGVDKVASESKIELKSINTKIFSKKKVTRYSVDSKKGKDQIRLLRIAIEEMQRRDAVADGNSTDIAAGYDVLRASHGLDLKTDDHLSIKKGEYSPLDVKIYEKLLRLRQFPHEDWNSCVHDPDLNEVSYPLFFLWHRAYLRAFELSVQMVLLDLGVEGWDTFGVPYWDWSDPTQAGLPVEFRPYGENHIKACQSLGYIEKNVLAVLNRSCENPNAQKGESVWNIDNEINPFQLSNIDFATFSETFRSTWHSAIHNGVGVNSDFDAKTSKSIKRMSGLDMGNSNLASRDPIFWVHHSNVDRLLVEWMRTHKDFSNSAEMDLLGQKWDAKKFGFPVIGRFSTISRYNVKFSELDLSSTDQIMGYTYQGSKKPSANRRPKLDVSALDRIPKAPSYEKFSEVDINNRYNYFKYLNDYTKVRLIKLPDITVPDGGIVVESVLETEAIRQVFRQVRNEVKTSPGPLSGNKLFPKKILLEINKTVLVNAFKGRRLQYNVFLRFSGLDGGFLGDEDSADSVFSFYVGTLGGFGIPPSNDSGVHQQKILDFTNRMSALWAHWAKEREDRIIKIPEKIKLKIVIVPSSGLNKKYPESKGNLIRLEEVSLVVAGTR